MRSAPARSFRRQSGLRMIVLAVNERRSPAESTNGNSALTPFAGRSASESSSSNSSGIASWTRRFGVPSARERLLPLVDREHDRALAREQRVEERVAGVAGSPVKPARASDFALRCATIWQSAQTPAASASPSGRRSPIAR